MADQARAPLITPTFKAKVLTVDVMPNLLRTTLSLVGATAGLLLFGSQDCPANPVVKVRTTPYAESVGRPPNRIPPRVPLRQMDWPTPTRARIIPQADCYGMSNPIRAAAVTVVLPFGLNDWQTPTRAKFSYQPALYRPPFNAGAPIVTAAPFDQTDWPQPYRAKSIPLDGSLGALPANIPPRNPLIPTETAQGFKRQALQADQQTNLLTTTLSAPAVTLPFGLDDWPQPYRARPVHQPNLYRPPFNPGAPIPPVGAAPFSQQDWPNPIFVKDRQQQAFTLAAFAPPPPFSQEDWPQPYRARQAPQADSIGVLPSSIPAVPPLVLPFGLKDWPQPYKVRPTAQADSIGLLPSSIPPPPPPFNQDEWPQPYRAKQPIQPEAPPNLVRLVIPPTLPFRQSEWVTPTKSRLDIGYQVYDRGNALILGIEPPAVVITPARFNFSVQLHDWSFTAILLDKRYRVTMSVKQP